MATAMTLECERCGRVIPMIERKALGWFIDFSRGFLCAPCAGAEDPNRGFVCHVRDDAGGAVYIGRAVPRQGIAASPWGNPFRTEYQNEESRLLAVRMYAEFLAETNDLSYLIPLRGKALSC